MKHLKARGASCKRVGNSGLNTRVATNEQTAVERPLKFSYLKFSIVRFEEP
jgi:hypothetical protein